MPRAKVAKVATDWLGRSRSSFASLAKFACGSPAWKLPRDHPPSCAKSAKGNVTVVKPAVHRACLLALAWVALGLLRAAEPVAPLLNAPWKIHQTSKPIYPPRLMQNAVTHGEARVRVSIDANGKLLDALVLAYTHREFGDEALRAVKAWRYEPGLENGEPIGVVGDITFAFEASGTVAVVNHSPLRDGEIEPEKSAMTYGAERTQNLDRIPTPTHVVPPIYPKEWSDKGVTGMATVEFYIDESGQARIPVVVSADQPMLGGSAAAAVSQWRFEPPTRHGKPVLVRAQQVFTFSPPKK